MKNVADICSECGATIPFARLEAEPTAERCIDCQGKLEANDRAVRICIRIPVCNFLIL